MNVKLIAHTQLSEEFFRDRFADDLEKGIEYTDGQAVALTAIRTCYSPNKPSEIVSKEGAKYFGSAATDGEGGTEADRLIRHITRSGHTSTLEHLTYTFAVEGVSRALLAQLTRHRVGFSFSVQSQRYVRLGSGDKSGGFESVISDKALGNPHKTIDYKGEECNAEDIFNELFADIQEAYDKLRALGVPPEDARAVLPNAAATNLVLTVNLRALLDFYSKRKAGRGAQSEICDLAEALRAAVTKVESWTAKFFEEV